MKLISIITVLALAVSAQAQTNAKNKKVKKSAAPAVVAQNNAPVEPVIVEKVDANPASTATSTVNTPAQTSVTSAEAVAPATKKISGGFSTEINADAAEANYNLGKAGITTTNVVNIGYKLNEKQSIKAEQYILYTKLSDYSVDEARKAKKAAPTQEDPELGPTRLSFSQSGLKVLGSDEFAVPVRLVIPTHETNVKKGQNFALNSPIEIPWTINPKLTLSTLLYPRYLNFEEDADSLVGGEIYGYAYYQATAAVQSYATVGAQNHVNMKNNKEVAASVNSKHAAYTPAMFVEVGANITLPAKAYLVPYVNQKHNIVGDKKVAVTNFELGEESEVTYGLIGGISF